MTERSVVDAYVLVGAGTGAGAGDGRARKTARKTRPAKSELEKTY